MAEIIVMMGIGGVAGGTWGLYKAMKKNKEEYQIEQMEQMERIECVKRYRQYKCECIPIKRKIRAEQRMKSKVEEAMNKLPIDEQRNIKKVL